MLNERLLQFIWQYSLFQSTGLILSDGLELLIINRGTHNTNDGPDFLNAKIKIGNTIWAGNIELHLKSSDWKRHQHQSNPKYQNIILHVVFEDDAAKDLGNFPTLVLGKYINQNLLESYATLMDKRPKISCENQLMQVPPLIRNAWLQRMLLEKWELKFAEWQQILDKNKNDWSTLFYIILSRTLGGTLNGETMQNLAMATPLSILAKHKNNLSHVESILFGQAGLIPQEQNDRYENELGLHYAFFKQKYQLSPIAEHSWKFLRMRPANFPTIRIAELAMIIHKQEHLFSKLLKLNQFDDMNSLFHYGVSEYWQTHFTFQKQSKKSAKNIGKTMQQSIWINVLAPLSYFYNKSVGGQNLEENATKFLSNCQEEKNSILNIWTSLQMPIENAADSQALIHLYKNYCQAKRCLDCSIGHWILKSKNL